MDASKAQSGRKLSEAVELRRAYGAKLLKILQDAGITANDYAQLGRELAEAQEPRRAIPYHDFTIEGWCKGELLPTPQAELALYNVLCEEKYSVPETSLDALDELHDDALHAQSTEQYRPTELSHAFKKAMSDSGLSQAELACKMAARNKAWRAVDECAVAEGKTPKPKEAQARLPTKGTISYIINYQHQPSIIFTQAMEQWCKPAFSLRAIHENTLRERAEDIWQEAANQNNLGGLILACRVKIGEGLRDFAQRIGQMAGKEDFGAPATTHYWENNIYLPVGDHQASTLYEPMVQAMKLADRGNALSRSIKTPWFDAGKEATFRRVFTQAVQKANQGKFTRDLPKRTPVEAPEIPEEVSDKERHAERVRISRLRAFKGVLSERIISVKARDHGR